MPPKLDSAVLSSLRLNVPKTLPPYPSQSWAVFSAPVLECGEDRAAWDQEKRPKPMSHSKPAIKEKKQWWIGGQVK